MIATLKTFSNRLPAHTVVPFFLAAALLMLPLSTSVKGIFLSLAVVSILSSKDYLQALRVTISQGWCLIALLFFMFVLIACCWSAASFHDQKFVIEKYSKLLYLPVLAVGFRDQRAREWGLSAFLLAMTITCVLCMVKFFHVIEWTWGRELYRTDAGSVFLNHIMTSSMMAFAAYISGLYSLRTSGNKRWLYAALFSLFTYQILFINNGRTGYVLYALLITFLIVEYLPWRRMIIALLVLTTVFAASYEFSENINVGVKQVIIDWQAYKHNHKDTSIGWRIDFHKYAKSLFYKKPLIGQGTAGFMASFAKDQPLPSWGATLLEPHSQYWLVASEFGVIGMGLLVAFFLSLLVASLKLNKMRSIALAMLLAFVLGNLSDSLLFYSGSGYFFILFMALCLGEGL